MRILIIETNLMWSVRLQKAAVAHGHEVAVTPEPIAGEFDVAIVNLGEPGVDWPARVGELRARGIKVVGHAGHKETALHQVGKEAGCDYLATNSELTHKLESVLAKMA